jgi:beta-glucosidase
MDETKPLDNIFIRWHEETDMASLFEIQVSSGGGQFITVFEGSPKEANTKNQYRFNETAGTDLRIRVISGNVKISQLEIPR